MLIVWDLVLGTHTGRWDDKRLQGTDMAVVEASDEIRGRNVSGIKVE
jgi:hypothetical protein